MVSYLQSHQKHPKSNIYTYILHILHIMYIRYIFCLFNCEHILHILPIHNEESLVQGFQRLKPLFLGSTSQGPAVHVPPPAFITSGCRFVAECSGKVRGFLSHGKGYRPSCAYWDKRKESQCGGYMNHIKTCACSLRL